YLSQPFNDYIESHSGDGGFCVPCVLPVQREGAVAGAETRAGFWPDRITRQGKPLMTSPLQQKVKITGPVVITANRLGDGAVVYRTRDGMWSTILEDAAVATTAPVATELLAAAAADNTVAVGAYVAPVRLDSDGRPHPGNLRESI